MKKAKATLIRAIIKFTVDIRPELLVAGGGGVTVAFEDRVGEGVTVEISVVSTEVNDGS